MAENRTPRGTNGHVTAKEVCPRPASALPSSARMPAQDKDAKIIGGRWGLSLTLVGTVVAAMAANGAMIASTRERVTGMEVQLAGLGGDLGEIKSSLLRLNSATNAEIQQLRNGQGDLRERVTRLEAMLKNK